MFYNQLCNINKKKLEIIRKIILLLKMLEKLVGKKHLKSMNYDRWAELYWKKQIEGNLTEQEQKELEKLEKENMETVEDVYRALKEDVKIKELIQKIKSHEWVKVIEGEG
ncbi:MAG: hypothetical protein DRP33_04665 [Thermotogae bacterium]|nr:MAG: hypothetical protein DRP33_04665 [Thermotogota bacterium]